MLNSKQILALKRIASSNVLRSNIMQPRSGSTFVITLFKVQQCTGLVAL